MIFSKGALWAAATIAATDRPGTVFLSKDGTVSATNRAVGLAVEPVKLSVLSSVPLQSSGSVEAAIEESVIQQIVKAIGRDSTYGGILEFVDIEDRGGSLRVTLPGKPGAARTILDVARSRKPNSFEPKAMLQAAQEVVSRPVKGGTRPDPDSKRIILDRKRILLMWAALDRAAPNTTGELPLWMSTGFEGEVVVRAIHPTLGQRVVAMSGGLKAEWLEPSSWELGKRKTIVKVRRK